MDDCACIYKGSGGDGPSVASIRVIKARKPQTCCECHAAIPPGTRYEFVSGCWDGDWNSYRTCLVCVEIRDAFCCEGYTYGQLWENACCTFKDRGLSVKCYEKLTTAVAKETLSERWRDWNGLADQPLEVE